MIFEQMFEPLSSTYTYLIGDEATKSAILIDPVIEHTERYVQVLAERGLTLVYTLETHVHADHVTAANALRARLGSQTAIHARGGATCADKQLGDGDEIRIGAVRLVAMATPGHTNGCTSYVMEDRVFTGDTLLIGGCGRTDFQQGCAEELYNSVTEKLFKLPDATLVFPAHDYKGNTFSTIGAEKATNPRLGGGKTKAEFVEIMANLKLAPPKQLDRAVPANQLCGREVRHVGPEVAASQWAEFHVVDVREPSELIDNGVYPGAVNIPMEYVLEAAQHWNKNTRLLLVCRSGARSAYMGQALVELGFSDVWNLAGGKLAWDATGASTTVKNLSSKRE